MRSDFGFSNGRVEYTLREGRVVRMVMNRHLVGEVRTNCLCRMVLEMYQMEDLRVELNELFMEHGVSLRKVIAQCRNEIRTRSVEGLLPRNMLDRFQEECYEKAVIDALDGDSRFNDMTDAAGRVILERAKGVVKTSYACNADKDIKKCLLGIFAEKRPAYYVRNELERRGGRLLGLARLRTEQKITKSVQLAIDDLVYKKRYVR